MKQTIEIEVPDGKIAVWEDGKVVFKDAKPPLPKTWKEFFTYYLSDDQKSDLPVVVCGDKDLQMKVGGLMMLHYLRDCYRQGWVPDWKEDDEKWVIYRLYNKPSVHCAENSDVFLSFPTEELAEEFLNNFRDLIEQAGDLI